MGMMGGNSNSYCSYCMAKGCSNGHVYCPLTPPVDAPDINTMSATAAAAARNWRSIDPRNPPLRTDSSHRSLARRMKNATDAHRSESGIKELSIFAELDSIIFPWSFTMDSMHLFFCNVVPQMFNHWRGKFTTKARAKKDKPTPDSAAPTRKTKAAKEADRAANRNPKASGLDAADTETQTGKKKFLRTDDVYNIDPEDWVAIGEDMRRSRDTFPRAFGDAVRSIYEVHHEFKAAEWKNWALLFSPVVLQGRLEETHYQHWLNFVKGLGIATDYNINAVQLEELEVCRNRPYINSISGSSGMMLTRARTVAIYIGPLSQFHQVLRTGILPV